VQHRFGGALNLNCHVHAAVIDGVLTRDHENERAAFHAVSAPDSFALGDVIERVYKRLVKWLRRHGLLAQYNHERTESTDPSAMDACVSTSLSQTGLMRLDDRGLTEPPKPDTGDDAVTAPRCANGKHGTESLGFNLHAGVRIEAHDRTLSPCMMQQGTMHGFPFPVNSAGAWQTSPPHITGVVGAVSVQVIVFGNGVPASPAVPVEVPPPLPPLPPAPAPPLPPLALPPASAPASL
jgi:hypothetical protein